MEGKGLWGASWQVASPQGGAQIIYSVCFRRGSFQPTCFSCAHFYSRGSVHADVLSTGSNSTINWLEVHSLLKFNRFVLQNTC